MIEQTDVFVIGGGPAGLAAAIAARKKGFRVVVADGARWPIEKACGEGLMPDTRCGAAGVGRERGRQRRACHARRAICRSGRARLRRDFRRSARLACGAWRCMRSWSSGRRIVASSCFGIRRWRVFRADGVTLAGGRACESRCGARWIVGADGIGSRVRSWAGLDAAKRRDCRFAVRRHYRMQPWSDFMEVHWGDRAQAYVTPVGADEICVVTISSDRGAKAMALEAEFPKLARRLGGAAVAGS